MLRVTSTPRKQRQEQIGQRLLAGQDVLAVMPTGAGKSICYQVPALLLPGNHFCLQRRNKDD